MNKKIILLTGYVAAGKTAFSKKLSDELNILCFNKDHIKAVLGKNLEINNRETSSKLSVTTFNLMIHIMEIFMQQNMPLILESNFKISEGEIIKELLEKYKYRSLTFLMLGDLEIIHRRFVERDNTPERDKANRVNGLFDEFVHFERIIKPLGDFNVGDRIIKIDTSDFGKVDFNSYIEEAKLFLNNKWTKHG